MSARNLNFDLPSPEATARLAASIGPRLHPGDVVLLRGEIGAGKTHFARALIHAVQETPEDVPSPSFTLVQEYDTSVGPVWHVDLYRLTHADEAVELGLDQAFATAICLVEWPDRLGDGAPAGALNLWLSSDVTDAPDARRLTLTWQDPRWDPLARDIAA